jgi:hypothetical protein
VEAVVQDNVRVGQTDHVPLGRLVEVRVDPRAHEALGGDPIAADPSGEVGDHPRRRDRADLSVPKVGVHRSDGLLSTSCEDERCEDERKQNPRELAHKFRHA